MKAYKVVLSLTEEQMCWLRGMASGGQERSAATVLRMIGAPTESVPGAPKVRSEYGIAASPEARMRQEEMIRMRVEGMTLQAIGDRFGVTRERVRQLTRGAVRIDVVRRRLDQRIARRIAPETRTLARLGSWWAKVDRASTPDGCWNWTGGINSKTGYGLSSLSVFGKERATHRQSFYLANGYFPKRPLGVLHRCGNPRCVRPDHLYEGTQSQNVADAVAARGGAHWSHGRSYRHAKNRERDLGIVRMRNSGLPVAEIASRVGLSESRVYFIIKAAS